MASELKFQLVVKASIDMLGPFKHSHDQLFSLYCPHGFIESPLFGVHFTPQQTSLANYG